MKTTGFTHGPFVVVFTDPKDLGLIVASPEGGFPTKEAAEEYAGQWSDYYEQFFIAPVWNLGGFKQFMSW